SVNNYNPISDDEYNNPLISLALSQDPTLILTWDIETYNSLRLGNFPTVQSNESNVFMICMSVHWKDDPNPLKQICFVDVETAPDSRWITVVCENQTNLLKVFALYWKNLASDIQIGFNDSQYDWRFIVEKAKKRALKETNATTAKQMCEVIEYCIINAISYQRLMVKHNAINEYREVASVAFILLYDSHYFAVGMKVRKYPRAYVFPLVKGLKNRRPVTERAKSLKESGKKLHEINFKFNGWDVLAWSIEHGNQIEIKGLYPKEISLAEARGEDDTDALKSEYSSVSFNVACLDIKQLALKVYMNTFYEEYFRECDEKFISEKISKEKYWEEMVRISMKAMSELRNDINDFLREGNGSTYLNMVYEEVLFPVVFTGKKKYYGIPHKNKLNFNNKLFIWGVETVKRKQSSVFRKIGKHIMEESTKINNIRTLHRVVEDVLKETVRDISQTDLNEIIKTTADAKWLIKKGSAPEPYLYKIPEPDKQFEYVVVENDSSQKPSSEIVLEALKELKDGNKADYDAIWLCLDHFFYYSLNTPPACYYIHW
ncbi:7400_t:CDS:2, partial [Funneliformis geosporum]